MPDTIHIKLPGGSEKEVPRGATAAEHAKSISPCLAEAAIAAKIYSNCNPGEGGPVWFFWGD